MHCRSAHAAGRRSNKLTRCPTVNHPADDHSSDRSDDENRHVNLCNDSAGQLSSRPNKAPITQPGHSAICTHPMTKPIANRLKNAPSNAAVLSGKLIGNIIPTVTAPKISPLIIPKVIGDMATSYEVNHFCSSRQCLSKDHAQNEKTKR